MPAGYKKKLADTDRLYYNTRYHGRGWVIGAEAWRTALLCLVVGAFGEVSEDLDRIVRAMAESRALYLSREAGKPVPDSRGGWILGQYRRRLSRLLVDGWNTQGKVPKSVLPGGG